ncbi:MAG: cation transporter [Bacteroidetes bacterium]|nr:cation transporter [Bacteroidota bacterium]
MKRFFFLLLLAATITACHHSKDNKTPAAGIAVAGLKTVEMKVKGMTCSGCETTIQTNVAKMEGVKEVKASYTDGKAVVTFDSTKTNKIAIAQMIRNCGYEVLN